MTSLPFINRSLLVPSTGIDGEAGSLCGYCTESGGKMQGKYVRWRIDTKFDRLHIGATKFMKLWEPGAPGEKIIV
jgi:hypothetical protein